MSSEREQTVEQQLPVDVASARLTPSPRSGGGTVPNVHLLAALNAKKARTASVYLKQEREKSAREENSKIAFARKDYKQFRRVHVDQQTREQLEMIDEVRRLSNTVVASKPAFSVVTKTNQSDDQPKLSPGSSPLSASPKAGKKTTHAKEPQEQDEKQGAPTLIEQNAMARRAKHMQAQKQYLDFVKEISDDLETEIILASDQVKDNLAHLDAQLHRVHKDLKSPSLLLQWDFDDMQNQWTQLEELCQQRTNEINRFTNQLDQVEQHRSQRIGGKLEELTETLLDTAHALPNEIERIIENEAYELNVVLIANRQAYADLIARLAKADVQIFVQSRLFWEDALVAWRNTQHNHAIDHFQQLLASDEFRTPHERQQILQEIRQLNQQLHDTQRLAQLDSLANSCRDLTMETTNQVLARLCQLHQDEETQNQALFARLVDHHTLKCQQAQDMLEQLRLDLHGFGALAPEPEYEEIKVQLAKHLQDTNLEEFFRKAGNLKSDLDLLVKKTSPQQVIYMDKLQELFGKVKFLRSAMKFHQLLEQQGKTMEKQHLQSLLEKIRKNSRPKDIICSLLPSLVAEFANMCSTLQINDQQAQEVELKQMLDQLASELANVLAQPSAMDMIQNASTNESDQSRTSTVLGETTTVVAPLAVTSGQSSATSSTTARKKESLLGSATDSTLAAATTTSNSKASSVVSSPASMTLSPVGTRIMQTLSATEVALLQIIRKVTRRLATLFYASELPPDAQETIEHLAHQFTKQTTANQVIDQVLTRQCDPFVAFAKQLSQHFLNEFGAKMEAQSHLFHVQMVQLLKFLQEFLTLHQMNDDKLVQLDRQIDVNLEIAQDIYETENDQLETIFTAHQLESRFACNEQQLQKFFGQSCDDLVQMEQMYRTHQQLCILLCKIHCCCFDKQFEDFWRLLQSFFALEAKEMPPLFKSPILSVAERNELKLLPVDKLLDMEFVQELVQAKQLEANPQPADHATTTATGASIAPGAATATATTVPTTAGTTSSSTAAPSAPSNQSPGASTSSLPTASAAANNSQADPKAPHGALNAARSPAVATNDSEILSFAHGSSFRVLFTMDQFMQHVLHKKHRTKEEEQEELEEQAAAAEAATAAAAAATAAATSNNAEITPVAPGAGQEASVSTQTPSKPTSEPVKPSAASSPNAPDTTSAADPSATAATSNQQQEPEPIGVMALVQTHTIPALAGQQVTQEFLELELPVAKIHLLLRNFRHETLRHQSEFFVAKAASIEQLCHQRIHQANLCLEDILCKHWPRKGRLVVQFFQPRVGELHAHQLRQQRHFFKCQDKLKHFESEFLAKSTRLGQFLDEMHIKQRALVVQLPMLQALASLQGVELRMKNLMKEFQSEYELMVHELEKTSQQEQKFIGSANSEFLALCERQMIDPAVFGWLAKVQMAHASSLHHRVALVNTMSTTDSSNSTEPTLNATGSPGAMTTGRRGNHSRSGNDTAESTESVSAEEAANFMAVASSSTNDYHPEEIEALKQQLQAMQASVLETQLVTRQQQMDLIKQKHLEIDQFVQVFKQKYQQAMHDLCLQEGIGPKFGVPKRKAIERFRSELTRSEQKHDEVQTLLKLLESQLEQAQRKMETMNESKSAQKSARGAATHQEVQYVDMLRVCVQIRAKMYARGVFLKLLKFPWQCQLIPLGFPGFLDAPSSPGSETSTPAAAAATITPIVGGTSASLQQVAVIKDADLVEDQDLVLANAKCFLEIINDIANGCRGETTLLYQQEGKALEDVASIAASGVPIAIENYLQEQLDKAKHHVTTFGTKMSQQVTDFGQLMLMAPRILLHSFAQEFALGALGKIRREMLQQLQNELQTVTKLKEAHELMFKPDLCLPNNAPKLSALCDKEAARSQHWKQFVINWLCMKCQMELHKMVAFETKLVQLFGSLMSFLDSCLLSEQDLVEIHAAVATTSPPEAATTEAKATSSGSPDKPKNPSKVVGVKGQDQPPTKSSETTSGEGVATSDEATTSNRSKKKRKSLLRLKKMAHLAEKGDPREAKRSDKELEQLKKVNEVPRYPRRMWPVIPNFGVEKAWRQVVLPTVQSPQRLQQQEESQPFDEILEKITSSVFRVVSPPSSTTPMTTAERIAAEKAAKAAAADKDKSKDQPSSATSTSSATATALASAASSMQQLSADQQGSCVALLTTWHRQLVRARDELYTQFLVDWQQETLASFAKAQDLIQDEDKWTHNWHQTIRTIQQQNQTVTATVTGTTSDLLELTD